MDEDEERTPLIIFGRDVSMIPCFRKSFLYGFSGGILGGLATFMLTSRPRIATHMSMTSFVGTTLSYWMYCRFNWSKQKIEAAKLQVLMEQHNAYVGTPKEKQLDASKSLPLVEA